MEGKGGVVFELFVKDEVYASFIYGDDLGAVEEAAGYNVEDLARFGAEDASEMGGLVAGEGSGCVGEGVGNPAAARHTDKDTACGLCDAVRKRVSLEGA